MSPLNYSITSPALWLHAGTALPEGQTSLSITEEGDGSTELLEYSHTADNSLDC
jgi:hypothetical protein